MDREAQENPSKDNAEIASRDPLVVGRVVGDVLDNFTKSIALTVSYGHKLRVHNGVEYKPSQVTKQPKISIGGSDFRNFYTLVSLDNTLFEFSTLFFNLIFLIMTFSTNAFKTYNCTPTYVSALQFISPNQVMVDPDAPSPSDPSLKEYLHWLVTDIPETTGATYGEEVVSYESPKPTVGIHRFVFVLFRQQGKQIVYAPGWRQNFITRDFAELYNLGSPVAAVFFNCQKETKSSSSSSKKR
ncbi:hypothetical protein Pint_21168 [Pistacia integerrima]|uniref:Uncharacterized protein n=1 Tax=Pistacia integerrima TaxID=434235 RepID=A0ACC0XCM3_9ROSI|nr:hypothetical protein Pint_21168 [Pistacia integerrima]